MGVRIKIRRDTAANWASTNPVLADGEQGYDKTNKLMKVGDGVTAWNALLSSTGLMQGVELTKAIGVASAANALHGLAKIRSVIVGYRCIAAHNGWAVDDEIIVFGNVTTYGYDATRLYIATVSGLPTNVNKTTGVNSAMTAATWIAFIRVYG